MHPPVVIYFALLAFGLFLLLLPYLSTRRRVVALNAAEPLRPRTPSAPNLPTPVRELPPMKLPPWQRLRPCRRGTQLHTGPGPALQPCQEIHIPLWAWPVELGWRLWRNLFAPPMVRVELSQTEPKDDAELRELFVEANDLLRGMRAIAAREGADTNWPAISKRIEEVLVRQHQLCLELGLYNTSPAPTCPQSHG